MKTIRLLIFILVINVSLNAKCQHWAQWGNGNDCLVVPVLLFDTLNSMLYAGGSFVSSTGDTVNGIVKWNGSGWDAMGYGVNGYGAMVMYNGNLCASSGDKYVYRWSGSNWDLLGVQLSFYVNDLVVYKNDLFAVGDFANEIAKWNDTAWTYIPTYSSLTIIRSAIVYKNYLYVGGAWEADSNRNNIMRWDGNDWDSLGYGIKNSVVCNQNFVGVWDLTQYNNDLYVAGCFFRTGNAIDDNPDNCIARWDGNNWYSVGGGLNGTVKKMVVFNGEFYVAGEFYTAGGVFANGIAKWDGTKWCSLGSNFYWSIIDMVVYNGNKSNNELIISGSFTHIDGYPIKYIAKWIGGSYVDTCGSTTSIAEINKGENNLTIYPNPSNGNYSLQFNDANFGIAEANIFNILGEALYSIKFNTIAGINKPNINITSLPDGIYLLRVVIDDKTYSAKIIKQ